MWNDNAVHWLQGQCAGLVSWLDEMKVFLKVEEAGLGDTSMLQAQLQEIEVGPQTLCSQLCFLIVAR